mmetsp:Transcript_12925/g.14832  ORF Transcript_12925/g.14832 Transcript_12925/m.14832 type:complete len:247 (+) Transcript_12925:436-1176(+)
MTRTSPERSSKSQTATNKFFKKRKYLFSRYDRGIKLDEESWYSVTPESIAEYIAERVAKTINTDELYVLDAFSGCGGNVIQFCKVATKVFGCEIDQTKIDYLHNNCGIYGVNNYSVVLRDYLESSASDFEEKRIDVVFLSPPWGGVGYTQMEKYKLEYVYPNFNEILTKSLEFSKNLVLFLPRNTDVTELCSVLSIYSKQMCKLGRQQEIVFEIERLGHYKGETSILMVYTGDLTRIENHEIIEHL